MHGNIVGLISTHYNKFLKRDIVLVYCLECAKEYCLKCPAQPDESVYQRVMERGTIVLLCKRTTFDETTEERTLSVLREGHDAVTLYRHQYCECHCDPGNPGSGRPLCPGKKHRDHARDAVKYIVEELDARSEPVTVRAIAQAYFRSCCQNPGQVIAHVRLIG